MPRPYPAQPHPDSDGSWPSCDDQPRGVSIRPLGHADLAALLAHLAHHQHHDIPADRAATRPVVAVRVRASVGQPGASAEAEYRRRRAAERAAWRVTVPWRVPVALATGVATGLLADALIPRRGGLAGVVAAAGLAWLLRFRPSADTSTWRRGAVGERRTARLLAPLERTAGRCCMTWPSLAQPLILTTW